MDVGSFARLTLACGYVLVLTAGTALAGGPPPDDDEDPRAARWRRNPQASIPVMVNEICRDGDARYAAVEILGDLGTPAVAPLLAAAARGSRRCDTERAAQALAAIVCQAQSRARGGAVTPAFSPVRSSLASADAQRGDVAVAVVGELGRHPADTPGADDWRRDAVHCDAGEPLLAASVGPLGRLLAGTSGVRRQRVTAAIAGLGEHAAPLTPALIRLLDDDDARDEVVAALAGIGPGAAPAVPALARLLEATGEELLRLRIAYALGEVGAAATPALPQLRARIVEAAAAVCEPGVAVLPWLLRAAIKIGPPPGEPVAAWRAAIAGEGRRALATVRRCDRDGSEADLIDVMTRLPPELGTAAIVEVMMDDGRSIRRRTEAATALESAHRPLAGVEAATQAALLARERRHLVPGQAQVGDRSTPAEGSRWRVVRAVAECDQDAGRAPPAPPVPEGGDAQSNDAMADCLYGRLCGPQPEQRAKAIVVCCRHAYGRVPPAWCRP